MTAAGLAVDVVRDDDVDGTVVVGVRLMEFRQAGR